MPYIGNTVQVQGFTPAVDYFSGNGVTVTFTLSRPVVSVAQMIVVIDNVPQNPSSAYTVSGSTITFTSAPLSGTNNIWVEYTSLITTYAAISQDPSVIGDITASGGYLATGDFGNSYVDGTIVDYVTGNARITTGPIDDMTFYHGGSFSRSELMTLYYVGGAKIFGTTALTIPVGTNAQRPGTPAFGMIRANTSIGLPEWYDSSAATWKPFNVGVTYSIEYVVVAGGGSGGSGNGGSGGGGAGGYIASSASVSSGTPFTITIGSGGAQTVFSANTVGNSGSNTVISGSGLTQTAIGGGGGGAWNGQAGLSGGSGGGGGAPTASGGSATSGQGNSGGTGNGGTSPYSGGGGGGAGAAGQTASSSAVANGGDGLNWQSLGTYYAGGGGAGTENATGGAGGAGGAGGGGRGGWQNQLPTAGTANTGGGGGGGGYSTPYIAGAAGGSGIVIIRYSGTTQRGTGGTVTTSGGYTYHTFTTSGTYTA